MKHTVYLLITIMLAALFGCRSPETRDKKMEDAFRLFHKLEGTWKLDSKDVYEQWNYANASFSGKVYRIEGKDTVITETLQLLMMGDTVYLRAIVSNQNQSEPVDFRMVEITGKKGVFVNPGHDFPTSISYELIADDQLEAWIQGDVEGINRKIEFHYTRQ